MFHKQSMLLLSYPQTFHFFLVLNLNLVFPQLNSLFLITDLKRTVYSLSPGTKLPIFEHLHLPILHPRQLQLLQKFSSLVTLSRMLI